MPLIPSSAYNAASQVMDLVRALVNDSANNWCTNALQLPYVNSSYRRVQRKLANVGSGPFITDNVELIVTAIPLAQQGPGTQAVINDATAAPNQLPSNLLVPLKIWERPSGSLQEFAEMTDLTLHDGLPSRSQGATLSVWEFRTDGIYFIGATQDTQIRLRYYSTLPDLAGSTDPILIRNAQEAIAFGAAAMIGAARGSEHADKYDAAQEDADEDVISFYVRQQQHTGRRRRPYGSRGGGYVASRGDW
jgi:hypothetical protein